MQGYFWENSKLEIVVFTLSMFSLFELEHKDLSLSDLTPRAMPFRRDWTEPPKITQVNERRRRRSLSCRRGIPVVQYTHSRLQSTASRPSELGPRIVSILSRHTLRSFDPTAIESSIIECRMAPSETRPAALRRFNVTGEWMGHFSLQQSPEWV